MSGTFFTTSAFSPAATYSTRADIENLFIRDDVTAWADGNSNGDADEISARIQWARQQAYIWVNRTLRKAGFTAPATAENFQEFESLPLIEARMAGVMLYESRGIRDQQGNPGDTDGVMQGHRKLAEAELADAIEATQAGDGDDATAPAGTFQAVTVRRAGYVASGDEYAGN